MILYDLRCGSGHGFEAWFRNSDTYDAQHAEQQIACPVCGGVDVSKAPMAPRIARSRRGRDTVSPDTGPESGSGQGENAPPATIEPTVPKLSPEGLERMRAVMTKIAALNRHVAETCDYVGNDFAEEARKIHYGETEHRDIYGEASPDEAAELQEEGIAVASLPWIRRGDS